MARDAPLLHVPLQKDVGQAHSVERASAMSLTDISLGEHTRDKITETQSTNLLPRIKPFAFPLHQFRAWRLSFGVGGKGAIAPCSIQFQKK